jgi:uncharacterized protein
MKVSGTATLHAPVDQVYAALNDPAVLVATIPGCERLEQVSADSYRMTVTAGVASIRGSFAGEVRLTDQQPPHAFVLRASGSGAPGTVTADVAVTLAEAPDATTRLTYDADAVVGGMVGGVGQRVLAGVAKKTATEFFAAIDKSLTTTTPEPPESPEAGPTPTTYTRPPAATPTPASLQLLSAAAAGALTALAGVALGWALARRGTTGG